MKNIIGTRRIVISAVVLAVAGVVAVMMLASRPTSSAMSGMAGMDHGHGDAPTSSPAPTPTSSGDMPGMDMSGTGSGSGDAHGTSPGHTSMAGEVTAARPLAPVLGTFGGGTSAVLLAAGFLRRRDRAATQARKAAIAARRNRK